MGSLVSLVLVAGSASWLGPTPPQRITRVVTIAPSLTETVLALGAGELLVGVSRFDEVEDVKALPRVGGFVDPSIETVLSLKPDLVIVQKAPGNQRPVEKLAALGVSVLALPLTSITDTVDSIRTLGTVLGHPSRAAELIADLDAARKRARGNAPSIPPTVLFVYGFRPLVVAGPGSFADELLSDCGAKNVVAKAPTAYPVWSKERLVAAPPQILVDASDSSDGREAVRAFTTSVRWVTLANKDLLHPGPSLGRGLGQLCRLLIEPTAKAR
jgi:iron complex transport system substrate-binding protein